MKTRQTDTGFVLRLELGEELIEALTQFAKDNGIRAGHFYGLGGLSKAELGLYDLSKRKYQFQTFEQPLELTNVTGDIAIVDGEPMIHAHATISDATMAAKGGHVKSALVAGTVELFVTMLDEPLKRVEDEATGLKLLDL